MGSKGGIIKERTNIRNTSGTRWTRFGDQLKVGEKRGKTMKQRFLDYFEEKKVDNFILEVQEALSGKEILVSAKTALIKAIK